MILLAAEREVKDFQRRYCLKCGQQISGQAKDLGKKYARLVRADRGGYKETKYQCSDCFVDAKGDPIIG
jgi:hypothetical protein